MSEIRTAIGRADDGDYEHFGLRVYRDLVGRTSYLGLVAFAITGRRLAPEDETLLDDLAVAAHTPEPRIFPMKLTWLAGCLGRAAPGIAVGGLVLDSDLLGGRVAEDATRLLVDLGAHVRAHGETDDAVRAFVESRPKMHGFGVPFREEDERLVAFRETQARRGRSLGRHWALAERLWRVARDTRRVKANIVGAMSAVCLDLGMTPREVAAMAAVLLQPTLIANAVEAAARRSDALRRLPAESVRYEGPAPRRSPRAIAS